MFASLLRTPSQLSHVTSWAPPAIRATSVSSPTSVARSKRGWEKTAVPGVGGIPIVVRWLLELLAGSKDTKLVESVLYALDALVKENPVLAGYLAQGNGDKEPLLTAITGFTKSRSSDVQIAACLCITHTLRSLPPAPPPPPRPHFPHGHGHSYPSSIGHAPSTSRYGSSVESPTGGVAFSAYGQY